MRRTWLVIGLMVLVLLAVTVVVRSLPENPVEETVSTCTELPLDGVWLELEATPQDCMLTIHNDNPHYIVFDLTQYPLRLELLQSDGWHRVLPERFQVLPTSSIPAQMEYTVMFRWKEQYAHTLADGTYRVLFYYGTGDGYANAYCNAFSFEI